MLFPPGALVFDIGAHHGESAIKFLNAHQADRVVCVEPELNNFLILRERWKDQPRVVPLHAAITRDPGIVTIYSALGNSGLSTVELGAWSKVYPDEVFETPQSVAALSIMDLVAAFGEPHFVKVDVEGHEAAVIRGLVDYLDSVAAQQELPAVSFEFHRKRTQEALLCLDYLAGVGYKKASFVPDEIDFTMPTHTIWECQRMFIDQLPEWGNFTVTL